MHRLISVVMMLPNFKRRNFFKDSFIFVIILRCSFNTLLLQNIRSREDFVSLLLGMLEEF